MSAKAQKGQPQGAFDQLGELSGLLGKKPQQGGGRRMIPLDLIDEDPNQPRAKDNPGFSEESIAELAKTIAARGVKTPISVRENPEHPGRFILNHGARRTRAARKAGHTEIPGFVDADYSEDDQVIENLQREGFTAREVANYIGRQLAKGRKKGEIAAALGKSAAFVSQHVTLLDLPEPISEVFNSGRVQDVTVVNELVKAHKKSADEVETWLADESQEITRGTVKLLHEYLDEGEGGDDKGDHESGKGDDEGANPESKNAKDKKGVAAADPEKIKKAILRVRFKGRLARIVMTRRPPAEGFAWVKYDDDGEEVEANLKSVELLALVEA